jgi:two-component system chemotaxis response regulator CheB
VLALPAKNLIIREPEDKEPVQNGIVYLAPQNYHLQIEADKTFSLDYSEPVNFSRPSIDVTFDCVASVYKHRSVGILLSGASRDGAAGISKIIKKGGTGIAQDPATAEYAYMPQSAIDANAGILILTPEAIANHIKTNFTG